MLVRKTISAALGAAAAVGLFATATAAPAHAAGSIDYTINKTFITPKGNDIPLRIGQHDTDGDVGFGARHIDDRKHRIDRSWDEFKDDIDEVLQHNATKCFKNNNENWECTSRLATGVGRTAT